MIRKIALVIPCYNEENRLNFRLFKAFENKYYFLFVNDGSKDKTSNVIKNNLSESIYLLDLKQNNGKANAVRQGMLYLKELAFYKDIDWVGFWDADLSTPLEELDLFLKYKALFDDEYNVIFGSRIKKMGSEIKRQIHRHYLGRLFATVSSNIFNLKCYDSQCGAKIFKKNLIEIVFSAPFISKWIFDIEIILRCRKEKILECPLTSWEDIKGGKLNIFKMPIRVFIDFYKMKKRYMN